MAPPPNDLFVNAEVVTALSGSVAGTTVDATDTDPAAFGSFAIGIEGNVFYKFPLAGHPVGQLTLTVTHPTTDMMGVWVGDLEDGVLGDINYDQDDEGTGVLTVSTDTRRPSGGVWWVEVFTATGETPTSFTLAWTMATPEGRINIALDADALEISPVWTRIDDTDNLVREITIVRGRQTELDTTDTSTATIHINDTEGLFDPWNASSPYFDKLIGRQILLQLRNPVTGNWVPQTRMWIHDITYDIHPATRDGSSILSNVTIECVDLFEYLARVEMIPGVMGDTPPADSEGTTFWEDELIQDRIESLLTWANLDPDWFVVFTGNVSVMETKYDPGDSILVALRDACDAEFPGIANCYTDKRGLFVFHGRQARFDPDGTAVGADWTFTRWKAGDGAAITLDPTRSQIRPPLQPAFLRSRIYNAAIAYPRGILEENIPNQVSLDATSISTYGYRSKSMRDLIVGAGITTGNTADEECQLYAAFYVANYAYPNVRVEQVTFKAMDPDDPRAERNWVIICNADISDIIDLEFTYPGGETFSDNLYIEGSTMTITPLNPDFDMVEVTFNVSPESAYGDDVGMLGT